jgi:hypothetical protein
VGARGLKNRGEDMLDDPECARVRDSGSRKRIHDWLEGRGENDRLGIQAERQSAMKRLTGCTWKGYRPWMGESGPAYDDKSDSGGTDGYESWLGRDGR